MQNYRVGFNAQGRCQVMYVTAHTKAAAVFAMLEKHPEAKAPVAVKVPDGVNSDKQWADSK